jgi:hypothetical protein
MTYASGKITGYTITEINNSYPSYSGINFYTQYGYKNILKPKFNEKLTGNFVQDLIGSGFMSQSKQSIASGKFYIATGILGNTAFRTGYKDFNITGSYISINGAIDWTGNLDLELGLRSFYTGTTLLQDIRARSFEYDIFRTGIINLTPNSRFFETTIESQKFFFATGYINFRSGIDFVESDMGKKSINGLLLTDKRSYNGKVDLQKLGVTDNYNKMPFSLWLSVFSDIGKIIDPNAISLAEKNNLNYQLLRSFGMSIEMLAYYDILTRFDVSKNNTGGWTFNISFRHAI